MTLSTRESDAAFADIVYADQQWVDAEFDALISASFSEPPAPPPPAPPRVPPHPGTPPPHSRRPAPSPAACTSRPPGRIMAGSARPRRISPAARRAAALAPDRAAASHDSDQHRAPPGQDRKENEQGNHPAKPHGLQHTAGLPGGSPALTFAPGSPAARSAAMAAAGHGADRPAPRPRLARTLNDTLKDMPAARLPRPSLPPPAGGDDDDDDRAQVPRPHHPRRARRDRAGRDRHHQCRSAAGGPAPRRRPPRPGPGGRHDPDPVLRLSRQVRRILALTALDRLIPVCASLDQALAHPPAAPTRAAREQGR